MIPYGRQEITQSDIEAVTEVLKSDLITQGPVVPQFERLVSEYCGAQHAVAVSSATAALHVACLALGLEQGDWLWTSPNTFVASANCGLYCGANVDFVDIDPRTYNLCTRKLADKLHAADNAGKTPKIVVVVHYAGQSCDMAEIFALSERYGFKVIEDASHAIGGWYKDSRVGSCKYSDVTVFSYHPVKIITSGEGGMALTNNSDLAKKMSLLRSHGITRDPEDMHDAVDGPWCYQQVALGFHYRMTDIHAALGVSQLERVDQYVDIRHDIAKKYDKELQGLGITLPFQSAKQRSSFHLYPIQVNASGARLEIFNSLRRHGIGVNVHYIPVHTQPIYRNFGFAPGQYPVAENFYKRMLSLPIFPSLKARDQNTVIQILKKNI